MTAAVVDASAIAALLFREPGAESLERTLLGGRTLFAPALIEYELANVAWKKLRRHPESTDEIFETLADISRLQLRLSTPDMIEVLALAVATGLTPYDASYLWLARSLGVPLVTLDRTLARAAEAL